MRLKLGALLVAAAILVLLPAVTAAQDIAPSAMTPQQLLALAATAGGKLTVKSYREIDSTLVGDRTVRTRIVADGDDYRETTTDGPIERSYGSYRGANWERDPNGVVVRMTGYSEANDPFRHALETPEAPESGARVLGVTAGAAPSVVLEVKPRDALVQRRYYDARTYLLQRVETQTYDGHLHVREYDDYRAFAGREIPYVERYHDGSADNTSVTRIETLERLPVVDPNQLAIPVSAKPFAFDGDSRVEIPATFTEDGIVVRLNVNGRGLDFLLDSGASAITIDRETARSLGLSLYGRQVMTMGGDISLSYARIPDVSAGPFHARDLAVDVIPFVDSVDDMKIVGLLGGDFFQSGIVTVDFKNKRLSIAPRLDATAATFSKVPVSIDDYVPIFPAQFNGRSGHFIADLGATKTVLFPHYFSQFKAPDEPPDENFQLSFVGGVSKTHSYRLSRMDIGDYSVLDVTVAVPANRKVEGEDYDGLLGRDVLSNFSIVFDYQGGAMYVKPSTP